MQQEEGGTGINRNDTECLQPDAPREGAHPLHGPTDLPAGLPASQTFCAGCGTDNCPIHANIGVADESLKTLRRIHLVSNQEHWSFDKLMSITNLLLEQLRHSVSMIALIIEADAMQARSSTPKK